MNRSKKKSKGPERKSVIIGIAWYSSDQWADLRHMVSDPETLESTYEEWQAVVRRSLPNLIRKGMKLVKVPVDVGELASWCRDHGRPIDADARAEFVVEALRQRGPSSFEPLTTRI